MNHKLSATLVVFLATGWGMTFSPSKAEDVPNGAIFEPPVRLSSDGKFIDTGKAWGHCAPCVVDIDGDGLEDLIVGDFSGKFRVHRNVGSAQKPSYEDQGLIQAGDKVASVNIYCCIGSQARFHDLNGDGIRDMIANSYDPGHCYVFWGQPNHRFSAAEELRDTAGIPIRSVPDQKQNFQSFGSFFELVDWENDGDLDLLIGCFDGKLKLRINQGTQTKPEFAPENIEVLAAGEPLKVKAHFCPKVADWDGDGIWDIIAGSDDGSVHVFRNVGTPEKPAFAQGSVLVEAHAGNGYDRKIWDDSQIVPGIRSQVEVVDYNGDGKLDLLVGDFYTAYDFKPDLTPEQKQEVDKLIADAESLGAAFREKMDTLRKDFAERYPGDQIYSDEATKAWSAEYQALNDSPEAKQLQANEAEFVKSLRAYLATTSGAGDRSFDLAHAHGHVWLFLRK
ncbi:MAG: VCBS repeat-containing protein [Pirellulales bacterium]